jgi:ubiquinol-cytochrome c reductase cytochrome b subunit
MIITAFIGYVLPWGQMSFWGATVITSLATVIPVVGKQIVYWLWGGFSIDHPTLNRFYSFHYTLPFLLAGLSIFHIAALHQYGSTNPLGINTQSSTIHFGTYFASKDLVAFLFLLLVFSILVFFYPEYLGQKMAVHFSNLMNYNNAMCWDDYYILSARFVSVLINIGKILALDFFEEYFPGGKYGSKITPGSVDFYFIICNFLPIAKILKSDQSAGNDFLWFSQKKTKSFERLAVESFGKLRHSASKVESSEATCITPDNFASWLAGLIEGDGTLSLVNNKVTTIELTLDAKDIQCLHKIKAILGFGSVTKRSNVNAYRYRISKQEHVLTLLKLINGFLLTPSKQAQLIKFCDFFKIKPIIPNEQDSINIIKNTSWLSGFFDAEGHFLVMNSFTLTCNISQKDKSILDLIKKSLNLGHIRFDKSWNGWTYTVSDKEGIRFLLNFFSSHTLGTLKNVDVVTFKRLLHHIDNKHHFKNSPCRASVENLITLFKNRLRPQKGQDL